MESEIARIIKKYDLDLFRLDYNTTIEEGGNRARDGFLENTLWRHVENLYAMFDRLRKQFPRVVFQNCAGGGGRLDWGIMRRFDNTELSDWLRAPRGLRILNGMTWVLPPEILLRTFGTETEGLESDGDLNAQLRQVMMALPIFRGISPSLEEFNPILRGRIRNAVDQYRNVIRPLMIGCRVYHHTPLTPMMDASPWMVLEYTTPDQSRGVAALFRTSQLGGSTYRFLPRGLNYSRNYRVIFGNHAQSADLPADRLLQEGIPVWLEAAGTSELLIFESK
jgi:alpha-galactosidase